MDRSLPDMSSWDSVFDETYLLTYEPFADADRTRAEALGAAALAGLAPGAEILDCPTGFGRHAAVLASEGYRVTGLDRSTTLLGEAERRRGDGEWPTYVLGDYRDLPFEEASFDAVFNLFSSLGYLERDDDVGVLRELRRVLRQGRPLIVETTHRDAVARSWTARSWHRLPDGAIYLEERELDWVAGAVETYRLVILSSGERIERPYRLRFYSVKEWIELLDEAGFTEIEAFGAWDGVTPATPDAWRLILRAR